MIILVTFVFYIVHKKPGGMKNDVTSIYCIMYRHTKQLLINVRPFPLLHSISDYSLPGLQHHCSAAKGETSRGLSLNTKLNVPVLS